MFDEEKELNEEEAEQVTGGLQTRQFEGDPVTLRRPRKVTHNKPKIKKVTEII